VHGILQPLDQRFEVGDPNLEGVKIKSVGMERGIDSGGAGRARGRRSGNPADCA